MNFDNKTVGPSGTSNTIHDIFYKVNPEYYRYIYYKFLLIILGISVSVLVIYITNHKRIFYIKINTKNTVFAFCISNIITVAFGIPYNIVYLVYYLIDKPLNIYYANIIYNIYTFAINADGICPTVITIWRLCIILRGTRLSIKVCLVIYAFLTVPIGFAKFNASFLSDQYVPSLSFTLLISYSSINVYSIMFIAETIYILMCFVFNLIIIIVIRARKNKLPGLGASWLEDQLLTVTIFLHSLVNFVISIGGKGFINFSLDENAVFSESLLFYHFCVLLYATIFPIFFMLSIDNIRKETMKYFIEKYRRIFKRNRVETIEITFN